VLPDTNLQAVTATDTFDWGAASEEVDEVVIDNGTDATITFVPQMKGNNDPNDGQTFTVNPDRVESFAGNGIISVLVTITGTGTVVVRGYKD
jgi:hypothetical protein